MAAHSSILAWKIPWTEEPGRLPFMGSQRVGTQTSARCYVAAWMGREFGEEWIRVYVWLNPPFAVLLKLSQHGLLIGYTSIQNQKFKKKRAMFLVSALELNDEKKEESIQRN